MKTGHGCYTWADGTVYSGSWSQNRLHVGAVRTQEEQQSFSISCSYREGGTDKWIG